MGKLIEALQISLESANSDMDGRIAEVVDFVNDDTDIFVDDLATAVYGNRDADITDFDGELDEDDIEDLENMDAEQVDPVVSGEEPLEESIMSVIDEMCAMESDACDDCDNGPAIADASNVEGMEPEKKDSAKKTKMAKPDTGSTRLELHPDEEDPDADPTEDAWDPKSMESIIDDIVDDCDDCSNLRPELADDMPDVPGDDQATADMSEAEEEYIDDDAEEACESDIFDDEIDSILEACEGSDSEDDEDDDSEDEDDSDDEEDDDSDDEDESDDEDDEDDSEDEDDDEDDDAEEACESDIFDDEIDSILEACEGSDSEDECDPEDDECDPEEDDAEEACESDIFDDEIDSILEACEGSDSEDDEDDSDDEEDDDSDDEDESDDDEDEEDDDEDDDDAEEACNESVSSIVDEILEACEGSDSDDECAPEDDECDPEEDDDVMEACGNRKRKKTCEASEDDDLDESETDLDDMSMESLLRLADSMGI